MTSYRRIRRAGATYFFTVALADRHRPFLTDNIAALRRAYVTTRAERPFRTDAIVILPDHLHAIWTLPEGDADYSTRWRLIKSRFSIATDQWRPRSASKHAKSERGLWQRRFWEHTIRDDRDHALHLRYCWLNPVKHALVRHPLDWPHSSLHRDVAKGNADGAISWDIPEGAFGE